MRHTLLSSLESRVAVFVTFGLVSYWPFPYKNGVEANIKTFSFLEKRPKIACPGGQARDFLKTFIEEKVNKISNLRRTLNE